jgi:UDP-glucose 4-epimerase
MILITGGTGSIGSHTAAALLELDQQVIIASRTGACPDFLRDREGLVVECADVADQLTLLELGDRHKITDIVHLAAVLPDPSDPLSFWDTNLRGLMNVLTVARRWDVRRLAVASSIGVYLAGAPAPWREDEPVGLFPQLGIPPNKQAVELITLDVARDSGFEPVVLRIGTIWGPLGDPDSPYLPLQRMINAAFRGEPFELRPPRPVERAGDGGDRCYVKDCGRAIALLITADVLNHSIYNVSSGRPATNQQFLDVLAELLPDAVLDVEPGRSPGRPPADPYLDISRLYADTGFTPEYDIRTGIEDYLLWLGAQSGPVRSPDQPV